MDSRLSYGSCGVLYLQLTVRVRYRFLCTHTTTLLRSELTAAVALISTLPLIPLSAKKPRGPSSIGGSTQYLPGIFIR